ncbi:MRN complex-interacting protein isoform 2-T2 [Aulostomus maculatus]
MVLVKTKQWSCKLCGEKQSLLKEFGRGSGADCRRHVQKLNTLRGAMMEEQDSWLLWKQMETQKVPDNQMRHTQVSCWSKYLDKGEEADLIDRQNVSVNMMDRKKTNDSWTCGQSTDSSRVPGRTTDPGCGGAWCAGFVSEEWEEPVGRLSQMRDGLPSCIDDITEATPLSRPQALRPGSYMFDSGDDFTFDL